VRAHRVEVAQPGDGPGRIGRLQVAQDLLAHQLGAAVDVHRGQRMGLGVGQEDRRAVDGGAGAEDEGLHAVALHHLQGVDQAADVVGVVGQRLLGRFAHRLEGREVHHRVDAVLAEDGVHGRGVADIGLLEHHRPAAQGFDARSTSGELLEKSSTPTTSKPAACSASQVWEAM
jgi:hypothetical protein